jgi:hypothetical protein
MVTRFACDCCLLRVLSLSIRPLSERSAALTRCEYGRLPRPSESFSMDSAAENPVFGVQRTWCLPRTPTGNILSAEPRSPAVRVRDEHQP